MENLLGEIWEQGQAVNDNFDDDDDDDDRGRDADGAMDGGVALNPEDAPTASGGAAAAAAGTKRRSSECDLVRSNKCVST